MEVLGLRGPLHSQTPVNTDNEGNIESVRVKSVSVLSRLNLEKM